MIATYVGENQVSRRWRWRRDRGGAQPAGHLRRAHARGGRGRARVLHSDRIRDLIAENKEVRWSTAAPRDGDGLRADYAFIKA